MHRRVPPSLVEEAAGAIQVVEVVLVSLAAPEVHVADLEVAPEVAGRVALRLAVVLRAALGVDEPLPRVLFVQVLRVRGHELLRFGPEGGDALGRVEEVDGKAVGLVVVLHVLEDVVVDVAEEVHVGLHAPVPPRVLQRRVVVEQAAVPPAHLVVGHLVAVLDVLLLQDLRGLVEEGFVDPGRDGPVFFGD